MDSVAGLLDGPRARNASLLRSAMDPPWSLRVQDDAPLTVVALVRGRAHVRLDDGTADDLGAGDVAVVRGPGPYLVADDPGTAPQAVILPGGLCRTPDGVENPVRRAHGVRSWGNGATGTTVLLVGTYHLDSQVSTRMLAVLPPLLVVRAEQAERPLVRYLEDEVVRDEPGQEAVLDRLLDLLLIATLRTWFSRSQAQAPGWYRAHGDPVVGPALRLLHHRPEQPWTVASLAQEVGVSRAALARRFTELVGEPPMAFLTGWRLTLAADLLREPGATLGSVARQVGYGSAFALSTAFKRVRGMSPRDHRLGLPAAAVASPAGR
jgi:AraC-like DNA-binding protein